MICPPIPSLSVFILYKAFIDTLGIVLRMFIDLGQRRNAIHCTEPGKVGLLIKSPHVAELHECLLLYDNMVVTAKLPALGS